MRITNKMLSSNMLNNINRNKQYISIYGDQYQTGQKIQRPSQDPVVAVRSLKYRSDMAELTQYLEKNIPDARAWMDVSEGALDEINNLLTEMNGYCVQGSNDIWELEERDKILANLEQYMEQIYSQGNTDYAGRYVFTGYRTDVPLLFDKASDKVEYEITEPISAATLKQISYVTGGATYDPAKTENDYNLEAATTKYAYRLRLSYDEVSSLEKFGYDYSYEYEDPATNAKYTIDAKVSYDAAAAAPTPSSTITYTIKDAAGTDVTAAPPAGFVAPVAPAFTNKSVNDVDAYQAQPGHINFIKETGELIIADDLFENMRKATNIEAVYNKNKFEKEELRPEHYFDCKTYDLDLTGARVPNSEKLYKKPEDQVIEYEINFSQKLQINTMANESITQTLGRDIDEILKQVKKVTAVEKQLKEAKKLLEDDSVKNNETQKKALETLKERLDEEFTQEKKILQEKFGNAITSTQKAQDGINESVASLGSRYLRLNMTEARLENQKVDFAEMQKSNDKVAMEDAIINFESSKVTYNASLSAASKVIQNTLLDFI